MSDSDQPDEHQLEPDEPMTTRREAMAAGAALMPMFLFDDDSDLGYFDTHRVLDTDDNGETVTDLGIDPEVLAFAEGLTVEERPDGGVQITTKADSELSEWAERDDGTLEGPALSTDEASVGSSPRSRDLISNSERTIYVPTDYDTVQDAVDQIKTRQRHYWEIRIEDGYDQAEDVLVEPFWYDASRSRSPDENTALLLTSDNNRQTLNSVFVTGCKGNIPLVLESVDIAGSTPYDDESTGIGVYGSDTIALRDITFSGGTNGIMSYDSVVMTADIDFGSTVLSGHGMQTKHGGIIFEQRNPPTFPSQGNVGGYAFRAIEGEIRFDGADSTATGDSGTVDTIAGTARDYANNRIWGEQRFEDGLDAGGNALKTTRGIEKLQRPKPTPDTNRVYLYVSDGSDGSDSTGTSIDTGDLVYVFTDGSGNERSKIIVDASSL